jgi:hypothetical protein
MNPSPRANVTMPPCQKRFDLRGLLALALVPLVLPACVDDNIRLFDSLIHAEEITLEDQIVVPPGHTSAQDDVVGVAIAKRGTLPETPTARVDGFSQRVVEDVTPSEKAALRNELIAQDAYTPETHEYFFFRTTDPVEDTVGNTVGGVWTEVFDGLLERREGDHSGGLLASRTDLGDGTVDAGIFFHAPAPDPFEIGGPIGPEASNDNQYQLTAIGGPIFDTVDTSRVDFAVTALNRDPDGRRFFDVRLGWVQNGDFVLQEFETPVETPSGPIVTSALSTVLDGTTVVAGCDPPRTIDSLSVGITSVAVVATCSDFQRRLLFGDLIGSPATSASWQTLLGPGDLLPDDGFNWDIIFVSNNATDLDHEDAGGRVTLAVATFAENDLTFAVDNRVAIIERRNFGPTFEVFDSDVDGAFFPRVTPNSASELDWLDDKIERGGIVAMNADNGQSMYGSDAVARAASMIFDSTSVVPDKPGEQFTQVFRQGDIGSGRGVFKARTNTNAQGAWSYRYESTAGVTTFDLERLIAEPGPTPEGDQTFPTAPNTYLTGSRGFLEFSGTAFPDNDTALVYSYDRGDRRTLAREGDLIGETTIQFPSFVGSIGGLGSVGGGHLYLNDAGGFFQWGFGQLTREKGLDARAIAVTLDGASDVLYEIDVRGLPRTDFPNPLGVANVESLGNCPNGDGYLGAGPNLYSYDRTTGVAALIGAVPGATQIEGLTCSPANELTAAIRTGAPNQTTLVLLDPMTAAINSTIGLIEKPDLTAAAGVRSVTYTYGPRPRLYAGVDFTYDPSNLTGVLEIDPINAKVIDAHLVPGYFNEIRGLAGSADGRLLGCSDGNLVEVDIIRDRVDFISALDGATCRGIAFRDSDGDDIDDTDELLAGTDPVRKDSDLDGLDDGREAGLGTDPNDRDTDGDELVDGWEVDHAMTDPIGTDDSADDPDMDGLTNLDEQQHFGDPGLADSDGDGLSDSFEVVLGTRLDSADTDRDGVSDVDEVSQGLDPRNPDSDGDSLSDGEEGISVQDYLGAIVSHDPRNPDSDGDGNVDSDDPSIGDPADTAQATQPLAPTPAASANDSQPRFFFKALDMPAGDLDYEIEISRREATSASLIRSSKTDSGFANINDGLDTAPFSPSGVIRYTYRPEDPILFAGDTIRWRTRFIDGVTPGSWSPPREYTYDPIRPASGDAVAFSHDDPIELVRDLDTNTTITKIGPILADKLFTGRIRTRSIIRDELTMGDALTGEYGRLKMRIEHLNNATSVSVSILDPGGMLLLGPFVDSGAGENLVDIDLSSLSAGEPAIQVQADLSPGEGHRILSLEIVPPSVNAVPSLGPSQIATLVFGLMFLGTWLSRRHVIGKYSRDS